MLKNCSNCGGKLHFSPKDKGNRCESCGGLYPVEYQYEFAKKPFEEAKNLPTDNISNSMKSIRCESCGANVLLTKFQMQTNCPYCGSSTIIEGKSNDIMYIDSIIPFSFGKAEALAKFKHTVKSRFYANKKIFKGVKEENINGAYVNAFVFDMNTSTMYSGTFSYEKSYTDRDGNRKTKTIYVDVSGVFNKAYNNITIEANSNLEQSELASIMPFEYGSAVDFKPDFMYGYMLEYQDRMFNDCVDMAESIIKSDIESSLLRKHNCDRIVSINMKTNYTNRKYNYCLLPVYFVSTVVKEKKYKAVMNGQTGKVGSLPKNVGRILLTVFFSCAIIVGIVLLIIFLRKG